MKLKRMISVFDLKTEKLLLEINVDSIPLEILKDIFTKNNDDPSMFDPYSIDENKMDLLNQQLSSKIEFDEQRHIYQLDCFRISE